MKEAAVVLAGAMVKSAGIIAKAIILHTLMKGGTGFGKAIHSHAKTAKRIEEEMR